MGLSQTIPDTKPAAKKQARSRYSITLSDRSAQLFEQIKEFTDADTDSEVFRNALRLSYAVMLAKRANRQIVAVDPSKPDALPIPIEDNVDVLRNFLQSD